MDRNTRKVEETRAVGVEALEALTSGCAGTRWDRVKCRPCEPKSPAPHQAKGTFRCSCMT